MGQIYFSSASIMTLFTEVGRRGQPYGIDIEEC